MDLSQLVWGLDAVRFAEEQLELRPDAKQASILLSGVREGC